MTDKLSLYNGALTVIGERKLANLTENREPRFKLDDIYGNDLIDRVLQHGQWNFAARSAELQASTSITPPFGYQFAFEKPPDFIRTMQVAYDDRFNVPITAYLDEAKVLFCDTETIYFQYVSNDIQFGGDFSLWAKNFTEYVEHYLGYKVAPRLVGLNISIDSLEKKMDRMLLKAKGTDAMESPAAFPPEGGWSKARRGFRTGRRDRGNRSQLIG